MQKQFVIKDASVNESLGLIGGFFVVSKVDGEQYFDLQGDHIPINVIAKAVMAGNGNLPALEMHKGTAKGKMVFAMPVWEDGPLTHKSGKEGMYGMFKFEDEEVAKKFASGEYEGFSIGGQVLASEDED